MLYRIQKANTRLLVQSEEITYMTGPVHDFNLPTCYYYALVIEYDSINLL